MIGVPGMSGMIGAPDISEIPGMSGFPVLFLGVME